VIFPDDCLEMNGLDFDSWVLGIVRQAQEISFSLLQPLTFHFEILISKIRNCRLRGPQEGAPAVVEIFSIQGWG
jgi:hypothetical protein